MICGRKGLLAIRPELSLVVFFEFLPTHLKTKKINDASFFNLFVLI
jgi:hypothetical protein